MWRPRFEAICRAYPDLVAVYESPSGSLALLLRSTIVPLPDEHERWIDETRRAVRAIVGGLRAAGLRRQVVILQWRSLEEVAYILRTWTRRYEGDGARRAELSAVVARLVEDHRYISSRRDGAATAGLTARRDPDRVLRSGAGRHRLSDWYRDMVPCWLRIEPPRRRQLTLRTHRWIVERVLIPLARGNGADIDDLVAGGSLAPDGSLASALEQSIPPEDVEVWRPWFQLVVADLRSALARPDEERTASWARWLFFIPLSIPVTRASFPPPGDRRGREPTRRASVALLGLALLWSLARLAGWTLLNG